MAVSPEFTDWTVDQLAPLGEVTSRRMFGGVGLYLDGLFFALIDDDVLYLKVDDQNRERFEAAGMGPFRPYGDERSMQYYPPPPDIVEDREALCEWAASAVDAARRAAVSKRKGKGGRKR